MKPEKTDAAFIPTRDSHLWLQREDDLLFEISIGTKPDCNVMALASRFSRCPLAVAQRVLDSEVPDMIGLTAGPGSEEEAEFLGLVLSGVPLQSALLWCTADESRPSSNELAEMMSGFADMRPATYMARATGTWLTSPMDRTALLFLAKQDEAVVAQAVLDAVARYDVPSPTVVASQVLGLFPKGLPSWPAPRSTSTRSTSEKRTYKSSITRTKSKGRFSSDAARRKYWARRKKTT